MMINYPITICCAYEDDLYHLVTEYSVVYLEV